MIFQCYWDSFQIFSGIPTEAECSQACEDFIGCTNYTYLGEKNPLRSVGLKLERLNNGWNGWNQRKVCLLPSLLLRRHLDQLRGLPRWGSAVSGEYYQWLVLWSKSFSYNRFLPHISSGSRLYFSSPNKPQFKCHRRNSSPTMQVCDYGDFVDGKCSTTTVTSPATETTTTAPTEDFGMNFVFVDLKNYTWWEINYKHNHHHNLIVTIVIIFCPISHVVASRCVYITSIAIDVTSPHLTIKTELMALLLFLLFMILIVKQMMMLQRFKMLKMQTTQNKTNSQLTKILPRNPRHRRLWCRLLRRALLADSSRGGELPPRRLSEIYGQRPDRQLCRRTTRRLLLEQLREALRLPQS